MAVEGDLKFLSHHDMMRVMERLASRAKLPLRYSRGFNPRPILSLPCPRPVGVASRDDVLVLALDEPVPTDAVLSALNAHAPEGMSFRDARVLPVGQTSVHAERMEYETPVNVEDIPALRRRIEALRQEHAWIVERRKKPSRRERTQHQTPRTGPLDVKPLIAELRLRGERLCFACVPHEQKWAKPKEILHLVGLSEPKRLARVVRTNIQADAADAAENLPPARRDADETS